MRIVFFIFAVAIMAGLVSASFGISTPYNKQNPLNLDPGTDETINFKIYNTLSNTRSVVEISVLEGSEIASLESSRYEVAPGGIAEVPLKVNVPLDASKEYEVRLLFKEIGSEEDVGNVQFSPNYINSFKVFIEGAREVKGSSQSVEADKGGVLFLILYLFVAFLAIGVLVLLVVYMRRRKAYLEGNNF